jgi:predicted adenine nucleotide alpha hydrolase (AANH) superfamily ATPase
VLFFVNPNIHPRTEHDLRLAQTRRYAKETGLVLLTDPDGAPAWNAAVAPYIEEPEGGARCDACFAFRLDRTAARAAAEGFDAFTTTLSVSPHKRFAALEAAGRKAAEAHGVAFLPLDFKKKDGFRRSVQLSREYGLTRQDYCGCVYSLRERDARQARKT